MLNRASGIVKPVSATGPTPDNSLRYHIIRTVSLAFPVMLARAGILILAVVDTAMTGHAGATELAYYAIAMAPQVFIMLIGVGLLLGTVVLTAHAEGAGRSGECGAIWRVSLAHGAVYGIVLMLLCLLGESFLRLVGQEADLARGGGVVLLMLGWSVPAMLLYTVTTLFLEGINQPLPGMLVMLLANLLNAALNWLFIYGHWGLPAMGAEGAALATTIARWFMFIAIAVYVLTFIDRKRYNILGPIANVWTLGRRLRRISYPIALSQGLESGAFSTMTLLAGSLGPIQVAAFQIAMTLVALVFMCALGFATAASIRVANALGRNDPHGMRMAGWVAVALVVSMLALFSVIFFSAPDILTRIYSNDPMVVPTALAAIAVSALVLVPDGAQAVLMGALRGAGDVWPATLLYLVAFWLVMIPLGYVLGVVHVGGAAALLGSVSVGCLVATVLLAARFHHISKHAVAHSRS